MATSDGSAAAVAKPCLWTRLSVNHTKKTCLLAYAFPFLSIAIIALSRQFAFDDPNGVDFFIRNDELTRLFDAREAAREQYAFGASASVVERATERPEFHLNVLFRGKLPPQFEKLPSNADEKQTASNVLTRNNLALLKQIEDDILGTAEYPSYCYFDETAKDCAGRNLACAHPLSLTNSPFLYGIWEEGRLCGRRNTSEPPAEERFASFLNSLVDTDSEGNAVVNAAYKEFVGKEFSVGGNGTWLMRSILRIGGPFRGYTAIDDRKAEQEDQYVQWGLRETDTVEQLSTEAYDVTLTSVKLGNAAFSDTALRDLSFCVVAIVLVFLVIWFHTGSAFLAVAALGQIFFSFPVAYVLYHFVFQQKYFAPLQILAIFLLLGIGADDVFVFTDAWKQSLVDLGTEADVITRMDWTYRRAVRAMMVTSVTTAAAFFVTAASPIMPISTLGVWAGLLVLVQFALVITAYPSAVILWHRFWSQRSCLPCFKRTESGSERGSGSSNHSSSSNMPFYFKFLPGKWQKKNDTAGLHYSFLERFFGGIWTKLIYRGRYALVVLALVLAGLGVYGATKLEPIQETEQFLPSDHPLRVLQTTLADGFGEERRAVTLQARVTWGISDIDRSGTSRFQPESIGRAVLDERFDLRRKEVQEQVRRACGWFVRREGLVTQQAAMEEAVDCWVSDYEQWRKQELKKDGLESFETHAQLAEELKRFGAFEAADNSRPYERYIKSQAIGFSAQQERVVFTEIRFVTGKKPALTAKFMRPIYNEWKAATEGLNAIGPEASGDRGAFVTSGVAGNVEGGINVWSWMRSQETLVISMFSGVGIMVGVALVTLTVCTMNWAVSLIATVCIGGLVSMLLGVMHAVGWELGTTETIAVVISIGYGFDGVAHMATAYVECGKEGRVERTRHALLTLGVSIWFGALSTLTSAVVLFAAMITFFVKFGGLLVCTVLLSAMWSLVLLPAVLMVVGPQGATGSVRAVVAAAVGRVCGVRRGGESAGKDERGGDVEGRVGGGGNDYEGRDGVDGAGGRRSNGETAGAL